MTPLANGGAARQNRAPVLALCLVALQCVTGVAQAHPRLLSSTPAQGAAVASTARMELHFSEPLVARYSGGELTMTSMTINGRMVNMPMKLGALTVTPAANDPKTMALTVKSRLASGAYRLDWHAVSTDTHRVEGHLTFTVK